LTKNQPKNYIKYLGSKEHKIRALFFLIPNNYEYKNLIEEEIKNNKLVQKSRNLYFGIITWEKIYENLKRSGLGKKDKILRDFESMIGKDIIKEIQFNKEEFKMMFNNKKYARLLYKKIELVDNVRKMLEEERPKFKTEIDEWLYNTGFWIKNKWGKNFWFGICYEVWSETNFPFYITYRSEKDDEMNRKRFEKIFGTNIGYKGVDYYYSLKKKDFDSSYNKANPKNVEKIVKFIKEKIIAFYK
jgi:hypothetical protein